MYAVLALITHAIVGNVAALAIVPYSVDPTATGASLWTLCMASALISTMGFIATVSYLSKRPRPVSGVLTGLLCGALCGATMGLVVIGIEFSLILYLTIFTPTLLAVLLASLLDRPKSGWQS